MVVAWVNVYFSILDEYEPASPENLRMSDPLRCNSKQSETFLPTLYMLDLYISMIYLYIYISYLDINSEFSIICVSWI